LAHLDGIGNQPARGRGRASGLSFTVAGFIAFLAFACGRASAHPHAWIDITVQVQFDSSGQVTALRQEWLFDAFYTADTVRDDEKRKMDALVDRILKNLESWGYFTRVRFGDRAIGLGIPTNRSARIEKKQLRMSFTTPLAEPVTPTGTPLSYSIYDPSYFIEMLHAEQKNAIRLIGAPAHCRFERNAPKPDAGTIANAAALDRTQSGGNSLGAEFAEMVTVLCDARR
jgi:ABC-type uncharacterized transport system substrate-binding protein